MDHDHVFGLDKPMPGERRTLMVIGITFCMMIVEIVAGVVFGSMALLADGLHMASHTAALAIAYFAYVYARRHAGDERFSFGTGKVNALAGFTGAILLAVFALFMVGESVERFINPVAIRFNQAILVAFLGLIVNGVSAMILGQSDSHHHDHHHAHGDEAGHEHHDHNLRSAYLHVIADALTSVLAIAALFAGKYFGLTWMDPAMGIVGACLVGNWSLGLVRTTSRVLLDQQGPESICQSIRGAVEKDGTSRVSDLHLWSIGPNAYAVILAVTADNPATPQEYKQRLPNNLQLIHVSIEVNVTRKL